MEGSMTRQKNDPYKQVPLFPEFEEQWEKERLRLLAELTKSKKLNIDKQAKILKELMISLAQLTGNLTEEKKK